MFTRKAIHIAAALLAAAIAAGQIRAADEDATGKAPAGVTGDLSKELDDVIAKKLPLDEAWLVVNRAGHERRKECIGRLKAIATKFTGEADSRMIVREALFSLNEIGGDDAFFITSANSHATQPWLASCAIRVLATRPDGVTGQRIAGISRASTNDCVREAAAVYARMLKIAKKYAESKTMKEKIPLLVAQIRRGWNPMLDDNSSLRTHGMLEPTVVWARKALRALSVAEPRAVATALLDAASTTFPDMSSQMAAELQWHLVRLVGDEAQKEYAKLTASPASGTL